MKIGFDIDDTLINLREHAFHIYNRKLKQNVPVEVFQALPSLEIHRPFGLTDEEGQEMWKSLMEDIYYSDCPPFPHVVDVLKSLEKDGHDIYYITSRPAEHCEKSREWLLSIGFPMKEGSFFCGMKDSEKVSLINDLGLDYYVDDKPAVLETLNNSKTVVFVKSNSYNSKISMPRFSCWSEFMGLIKKSK